MNVIAVTSLLLVLIMGLSAADPAKLALKNAEMKSTYGSYAASRLIDGDGSTFAHTLTSYNGMWVRVFLAQKADISRIVIHNREDCCQGRLDGYTVYIKSGDERVKNCGTIRTAKDDYTFQCSGSGDSVEISKDGRTTYQNIGEIEVYGTVAVAGAGLPMLILYSRLKFQGEAITLKGPTPDFESASVDFDNDAQSVWAVSGDWELYTGAAYTYERFYVRSGQKVNAPQRNAYSAARPANCRYVQDPTTARLRVSKSTHFQNGMKDILTSESSSSLGDWDDAIKSVIAEKGDWELYTRDDFSGSRKVVKEGEQIEDLKNWNNIISAVRPICESYKGKERCIVTSIEVLDSKGDLDPRYTGTEIIGSQSSGSCYGPASHEISIAQVNAIEESIAMEVEKEEEVNWGVEVSVGVSASANFLGSGTEVSMGVSVGVGGAVSMGTKETKETKLVNEKEHGLVAEFNVPGAGLLFGVVDRYEVDKAKIPTKMHLSCPNGQNKTIDSSMDMKKVSFGAAHFWSLTGEFTKEACKQNRRLPQCVDAVRKSFANFVGQRAEIMDAFEQCFSGGKGEF